MSAIYDMNQGLFCDIVFDQIEMLYENQSEQDLTAVCLKNLFLQNV
jgi:hypothetical protein